VQARRRARAAKRRSADIDTLEEELRQALGTRVRVVGTLARGRVELPYTSAQDLERLHARLVHGSK
jgi:ParB family chromosome partitioning protein